jgi:hypothetical protein
MKHRHSILNEIKNRLTDGEFRSTEECMNAWVENHPGD